MTDSGQPARVDIYDTTLRDGSQGARVSLSCDDKLRIAERLDRFGVAFVEGGWPGSNPKDAEFFARARDLPWRRARLVAFGATRRVGVAVEDDPSVRALLEAATPVCAVVGKSWLLHVTEVLRTSREDNLSLIADTVGYLVGHGRRVVYDAEHFFDGWADDPDYALETLRAAARAGAEVLVLCDTNGGALPWQVGGAVAEVVRRLGAECRLGIHCHDDGGCAVASTLAAVVSGASHVQGTVNGYGERCGNADLCAVVANLELKLGRRCLPGGALAELEGLSRFVAEIANLAPDDHAPYVGRDAFAHKGGIHVAAMRRSPRSYQHVDPARVGNRSRVVVSELSGRGNLLSKAEELGLAVSAPAAIERVVAQIKDNEARGFSYHGAEGSVELLLARRQAGYRPPFRLIDYMVNVEHRDRRGSFAEATVKVEVAGQVVHTAAEGAGPVDALDRALRKALLPVYPALARVKLEDYKVRILDGYNATAATTRVLVVSTDGQRRWSTVGASANIIEASWRALADAFELGLRGATAAQSLAASAR